ncbi:MAG: group 1 truncated hemoglobin [Kofleriaceae bacterium]
MTAFDRIGGDALRAVIRDFYDHVVADVMIGFLFAGKDHDVLVEREWEFTARLLGADVPYRGRPIRAAHAASPILGGHFERRTELLRQAMARHAVDPEVQRVWLEHTEALRAQVTRDRGSDCDVVKPEPPPSDAPIKLGRRRS